MKAKIVKIGNSQGIRIPKPLIEQTGISEDIEISISGNTLVISSASSPRSGWADGFERMRKYDDDVLLDAGSSTPTTWEEEEWVW